MSVSELYEPHSVWNGKALRRHRERLNLSLEAVGNALNRSTTAVHNMETKEGKRPVLKAHMDALCALLACGPEAISVRSKIQPPAVERRVAFTRPIWEICESRTVRVGDVRLYHREAKDKFRQVVRLLADNASDFILYSRCCKTLTTEFDPGKDTHLPDELADPGFLDRIWRKEIEFRRVEVFHSQTRFLKALELQRDAHRANAPLTTKFFPASGFGDPAGGGRPELVNMPVINVRSYDHAAFVVGGYSDKESRSQSAVVVESDRDPLGAFLSRYCDALWHEALPLWDAELANARKLASSLGIERGKWEAMARRLNRA